MLSIPPDPPRARSRMSPALVAAIATGLLALHWWLGVSALINAGMTNDEPLHLTAGYSYWHFHDFRLQPENGNLPQRWAALPLLWLHPHLDPAEAPDLWTKSEQWLISYRFFFQSGNSADYLLFCGRACTAFWSVATGMLVLGWARRLWGDVGGLFSLALFCFSPTALAHGPLITSDMCASFWLLAAAGSWWETSHEVSWRHLGFSCGATGLAFVAKFSAVLLLPVFLALMIWRALRPEPLVIALGNRSGRRRSVVTATGKLGILLALLGIHAIATWLIIWTFFGWRYHAFASGLPPAGQFYIPTEIALAGPSWLSRLIALALKYHFLPEAYLHGFAHVLHQGAARGAFLLGQYSIFGWWWFFPFAFFAKSTIGELVAASLVLFAAAKRWSQASSARLRLAVLGKDLHFLAPLLVLGTTYLAFSLLSTLNIGHRHILPLYPLLFILCGALLRVGANRWIRLAALAALVTTVVESCSIRPDYLAFFNGLVGGPTQGWRQLVDSSLDWGQNLPKVAQWVAANRKPDEALYCSYFGSDDPAYEGLPARDLAPYYSFDRGRQWFELQPGLYCISATLLQDVYSPFRGKWTSLREQAYRPFLIEMRAELASGVRSATFPEFSSGPNAILGYLDRLRFARLVQYLRVRRPDAVIHYNIFVFRLSAEEIHAAVDGTLKELADMMQRAMESR